MARDAAELEAGGAYARAAEIEREMRRRLPLDGDLELALAINEARIGATDSALVRLFGPTLKAAEFDSLPVRRRHEYPYNRELAWGNGRFDGWHWYVWRARAELLAERGRWNEARDAARQCVAARALSGKEWLILAVCAGRAGDEEESREATARAIDLDPTLPEAYYLSGLWDWRKGQRSSALARFRQAVALDSSYAPAALAMIRSRVPGVTPDTLPTATLTGVRRVGLLTSAERPKPEEMEQMDITATLLTSPDSAVVDSLRPGVKPVQITVSVLVDEKGHVVLNEIPWFSPAQIDYRKITRILSGTSGWVFNPARRLGQPRRVWVGVDFYLNP